MISKRDKFQLYRFRKTLATINQLQGKMKKLSDDDLRHQTTILQKKLSNGATLDKLLPEAYATIREAAKRLIGLFAYDEQLLGSIALHHGYLAEMKTGEGKTLTAIFPLYLNALTKKGAILVTTNDYLAKRDAEEMGKVFEFLGLCVGLGVFDETEKVTAKQRRAVYEADITYTTSTSLGFDYLTNNLASSKNDTFLRKFHYVIIDEADAVLLDSAQTPLIISGSPRVRSNLYDMCDQFVETLRRDTDYYFDEDKRVVYFTKQGIRYAESYFDASNLYASKYFELNRQLNLALRAHHLYQKNRDYVVSEGEVKLLDHRTGRILEGTRLQSGIYQAIETKERVKKSQDSRAMASVTYQSLFKLFPKMAGMSGTLKIAEEELIETYGLSVITIPTHKPLIRVDYPDKIYTTIPEKLKATVDLVKERHAIGQPILLVSGTVELTELYSKLLLQEGIPHNTLTASNAAKEAQMIAEAGQVGAVTVSTPMAGRGTDIKLGRGVADLGGLCVIGSERMPNSRVDWQLRGRSGRQGDPGMSIFFASLEDELLIQHGPKWLKRYFQKNKKVLSYQPLLSKRFRRALHQAQEKSEDSAKHTRQMTIQFDESLKVQRQKIYALRTQLIDGDIAVENKVDDLVKENIRNYLKKHPIRTKENLKRYILENYSYQFYHYAKDFDVSSDQSVQRLLWHLYRNEKRYKEKRLANEKKLADFYRLSILKAIDTCWIDQVDHLQQLKLTVPIRQIAQRNTLFEYYHESFESYHDLSLAIKKLIVQNVMLSKIEKSPEGEDVIYFV